MRPLRLLFDENVSRPLERALRRGSPATRMFRVGKPGAPALETGDPELLSWCECEKPLLISRDRATLPKHHASHLAAGHHSWGVFLLRKKAFLAPTIADLLLVLRASLADDWRDLIEYVPFDPSEPRSG